MVKATGVGYSFRTLDEAERFTREALENEDARNQPDYIATKAKIFSSETFEKRIAHIAMGDPALTLN